MSDLSDFLQDSAGVGQNQGVGEFTLSPQEAWKRLQHSLPCPEYWVLKLLQMAVAWKAERFCVSTDSEQIVLDFDVVMQKGVDAEAILDVRHPGRGLNHLRVALAGASCDPKVNAVELFWENGATATHMIWSDGELKCDEQPRTPFPRSTLRLKLHHQELGWFKNIFGEAPFTAEKAALRERAFLCPIPILIDSELFAFEPPPSPGPSLGQHQEGGLRIEYFFHRRLQLPRYLDFMTSNNNRVRPRLPHGSHLANEQSERVRWVQDGVVVDEWSIESVSAVAGCFDIETTEVNLDLSGFGVVKDKWAVARLARTREPRRKLLKQADQGLEQRLGHEEARREVYRSVWGVHLLVGILFLPYLMLGFVELFRLPHKTSKLLEIDLRICREHLERRLENLQDEPS